MLGVRFAFEDSNGLVNRNTTLNNRGIGWRSEYEFTLDALVYTRCKVVREYLDLIGEPTCSQ